MVKHSENRLHDSLQKMIVDAATQKGHEMMADENTWEKEAYHTDGAKQRLLLARIVGDTFRLDMEKKPDVIYSCEMYEIISDAFGYINQVR